MSEDTTEKAYDISSVFADKMVDVLGLLIHKTSDEDRASVSANDVMILTAAKFSVSIIHGLCKNTGCDLETAKKLYINVFEVCVQDMEASIKNE